MLCSTAVAQVHLDFVYPCRIHEDYWVYFGLSAVRLEDSEMTEAEEIELAPGVRDDEMVHPDVCFSQWGGPIARSRVAP